MDVNVINERDINSTDASRLVHNRFPTVTYRSYGRRGEYNYKNVDYNDIWGNRGIRNASLTSLYNLKKICIRAKDLVENYNKNSKEKYRLRFDGVVPASSLKAAMKAGIITGTPATKEYVNKRYVNMDDPNDVITFERWVRKKAVYYVRPDVDYKSIIEELNKFIGSTLEAFNG